MKVFLLLLMLAVVPISVSAQNDVAPISGVVMGSGFVEDNLDGSTWGGGLKFGFQTSLDADRSLSLRTMYNRFEFGPAERSGEAFTIAVLSQWWLGKKWSLYIMPGTENYVGDGDFSGTDWFGGIGFTRLIWTDGAEGWSIPAQAKVFAEVVFVDADAQPTGNYFQMNIGLLFSKPVK